MVSALRAAYRATTDRMAEVARSTSGSERLRKVVYESLPLDDERLREWKVWIAFWAAAAADEKLAQENAQRYREWKGLLSKLIAEIHNDPAAPALELVSLIDGLGIRTALVPSARNRRLARGTVDRWIGDLADQGSDSARRHQAVP